MHRHRVHAALLYALFLTAFPLRAQQPEHRHQSSDTTHAPRAARGSDMMMDMCPMMTVMRSGPAAALRARDTLRLSTAQVTQLEALQQQVARARARAMDSMRVFHRELAALTDAAQFDEPAARLVLDRAGRLHTDLGAEMLRAQHETQGILTPQQRTSLAALGHSRMHMESARPRP